MRRFDAPAISPAKSDESGREMQKTGHVPEPLRIDWRIVFPVLMRDKPFEEHVESMNAVAEPYLHLSINAVDTVVLDPEGRPDNDRSDRFDTFDEARDAASHASSSCSTRRITMMMITAKSLS